jgi:lysophospholipase L1-like esterase
MGKLVVTGDSLSSLTYITEAQGHYGRRLADMFGFGSYVNTARDGYYAEGLVSFIFPMVLEHSPDEVVVMIGTNDAAQAAAVGTDVDGLRSVMNTLATYAIKGTFLSPPPSRNAFEFERLRRMSEALGRLCLSQGVNFVDVFGEFVQRGRTSALFDPLFYGEPDKYHLGIGGHNAIVDAFTIRRFGEFSGNAPPTPPQGMTGVVYQEAVEGGFGNTMTQTVRTILPLAPSTPSGATKARLTLKATAAEPFVVDGMFAGPLASGYAAASLSPVKVGGATAFTVPQGGTLVTDWFPIGGGVVEMLVSFYAPGPGSLDALSAQQGKAGAATYIKYANEPGALAPSGYAGYPLYASLVSKIETDGF